MRLVFQNSKDMTITPIKDMTITLIAYFHSPFGSKFGIPCQSGIVEEAEGEIHFVEEYQNAEAVRGLEYFEYLWLIWEFSANSHVHYRGALHFLGIFSALTISNERIAVYREKRTLILHG